MEKKRKMIATITALSLVLAVIFWTPEKCEAVAKQDYKDHWAQETIQLWLDNEMVKGYPDGTFRPDTPIKRSEFMAMVNKTFEFNKTADVAYLDVAPQDWFYQDVAIAREAGYITGYPDGKVRPNNFITREEVAAILMKIQKLGEDAKEADQFVDSNLMTWSKGAVGAMIQARIMEGYQGGNFNPKNTMKRCEALVSLDRALKILHITPPDVTSDDTKDTVKGITDLMEYNLDSVGWIPYDMAKFSKIDLTGVHTLLVRYIATGESPASQSTILIFTAAEIVPLASGPSGLGGNVGDSNTNPNPNPNPVVIPVDKSELNKAIKEANDKYEGFPEGIEIGEYPTEARESFGIAIHSAELIALDISSNKEQVDQGLLDLETANTTFDATKITEIDISFLRSDVNDSDYQVVGAREGIAIGKYAKGSKDAYKSVIRNAKDVLAHQEPKQWQVNEAVNQLHESKNAFESSRNTGIEKEDLIKAILDAQEVYEGGEEGTAPDDYETGSKEAFLLVIEEARLIGEEADATMERINEGAILLDNGWDVFAEAKIASTKLLFTFDDGYKDLLDIAAPKMKEQGFKGTAYVNKSFALSGQLNIMDPQGILSLYNNYGWDIENHSTSHKHLPEYDSPDNNYVDAQEALEDYVDNLSWLRDDLGLTESGLHTAYAFGERNQDLMDGLKSSGFKTGRFAYYGIQGNPVTDFFQINCQEVGRGNLEITKGKIDEGLSEEANILLLFHRINDIDEGENAYYTVGTLEFEYLLKYVKEYSLKGEIDVVTMTDWYMDKTKD